MLLRQGKDNEASIRELKRLGVKIIKQKLKVRDPAKQRQISRLLAMDSLCVIAIGRVRDSCILAQRTGGIAIRLDWQTTELYRNDISANQQTKELCW